LLGQNQHHNKSFLRLLLDFDRKNLKQFIIIVLGNAKINIDRLCFSSEKTLVISNFVKMGALSLTKQTKQLAIKFI
jgi:hypothetical protein